MSKQEIIRLSEEAEKQVAAYKALYPSEKSAVMPLLYMAQEELGWLTNEAILWVADRLSLAPSHVREVATFYTMYYKKPVGKYHIQLCRTLSCMLCGAKELAAHIKQRLGVKAGQVTENGFWSFEEVECLGSCGTAPMVEINDIYFENLTSEKLDAIMDRIEKEQPNLRYSAKTLELGDGFKGFPKSEVWVK